MNTDTGEIVQIREDDKEGFIKYYKAGFTQPVSTDHLSALRKRELNLFGRTKVRPNEKCPCGSDKKFKKCCWSRAHIGPGSA